MSASLELAHKLHVELEKASALCNESLIVVKHNDGMGELKVYHRLVGLFMGESYTNLLAPLWREFPQLEPEAMKTADYVEPQPSLTPESREAIAAFLAAVKPALELSQEYAALSPEKLPFGGLQDVANTVDDIERFLANPGFTTRRLTESVLQGALHGRNGFAPQSSKALAPCQPGHPPCANAHAAR